MSYFRKYLTNRTISRWIGTLMFPVACVLFTNAAVAQSSDINVGVILPLSGEAGVNGKVLLSAYEIARDITNEQIAGKKIALVPLDSPNPTAAQQNARKLVGDGTKIVIGSIANDLGLPASAEVDRGGGTYYETTAVSEEFTDRGLKNVFRASAPGAQMGTTAIDFVVNALAPKKELEIKGLRVAIVYEPNWQLIAEAAKSKAESNGMNVVVFTDYDAKTLDFSSLVLQLKNAKADVVLAGGWLNDSVLLNKQSHQAGFTPKAWIGLSGGHSIQPYAEGVGSQANGVFVVNASSTVGDSGLTKLGLELKNELLARWAKKNAGEKPGGLAYEAFGNAWALFHDVLPKAASLDQAEMRSALLAADLPEGSLPNGCGIKFDETGANTRSFYTVLQWQNDQLGTVWPDKFATVTANYQDTWASQ